MEHKPLQFYVDKLKNNEPFSLVRFGDGELYCMWGRQGHNSNGCDYTPELRADLQKVIENPKEGVIYGLQRVLPGDQKRAEQYGVEWYDSEVFGDELVAGKLYPLIEVLKEKPVVIISNPKTVGIPMFLGPRFGIIEVGYSNAHKEKNQVYSEIDLFKKNKRFSHGVVYIFCCGMAGTVFPYELHDGKNWYLDLGHIFDPFVGNMSRCNLEGMTKEQIERNLYASV